METQNLKQAAAWLNMSPVLLEHPPEFGNNPFTA